MMRKTILVLLACIGIFVLYVGGVLLHGTWADWQPEGSVPTDVFRATEDEMVTDTVFSLALWNIGYAGLGEESDFFYDNGRYFTSGGQMIRATEAMVAKNLAGAALFTASTDADFFLFQEVDMGSRRSYFTRQVDTLAQKRPAFAAAFAPNYKVARMPLPVLEPWRAYGKVYSGIATLGRWQPYEQMRVQLPGTFPWPTRIFQLDRCMMVNRYKTSRGRDLVVINAHLSAYDKGGELKREQMAFLRQTVLEEYEKGHYVIVGADWNQCPPFFPFDSFMPGQTDGYTQTNIAPDFLPEDWQWVYDPTTPTNRKLNKPYDAETSFRTIIDFFLISPNLQATRIKTIDQQFRFSDHQPVWMEVALLP
ncbi:MAG: endonuclease/exonuclease/phosphatase family protein [Saprospiraceae bacterium]